MDRGKSGSERMERDMRGGQRWRDVEQGRDGMKGREGAEQRGEKDRVEEGERRRRVRRRVKIVQQKSKITQVIMHLVKVMRNLEHTHTRIMPVHAHLVTAPSQSCH